MAVFRKFKGLNIKYSYRDPQKAPPYLERRVLMYFALKSISADWSICTDYSTRQNVWFKICSN